MRVLLWMGCFAFAACKGCSCVPGPPDDPDDDPDDTPVDTSQIETADTAPPDDTAPPPPCDVPEVEPNTMSTPQVLPRDQWACGVFDPAQDWETFEVASDKYVDWYMVKVEAASIGSPANPTLYVYDCDLENVAAVIGRQDSTDPYIVFPAIDTPCYYLSIYEADYQYGKDFRWKMMASETKMLLEWNKSEVEPNDLASEAMDVYSGDVLYGLVGEASDYDWFHVVAPAAESVITFNVEAYGSGSITNANLKLYDTEVLKDAKATPLERAYVDENSYDLDPRLEYRVEAAGDYYLLLWEAYSQGSPYSWYTMTVTVE